MQAAAAWDLRVGAPLGPARRVTKAGVPGHAESRSFVV